MCFNFDFVYLFDGDGKPLFVENNKTNPRVLTSVSLDL